MEGDSWSCRNPADKAEADGQARETRRLRGVNNHPNNMEAAPKTSNRAAVHTFNAILTLLIFLTFSTVFCAEKGGKQIERALVGGRGGGWGETTSRQKIRYEPRGPRDPRATYGVERVALVDGVLVVRLQLVKRDDLQGEKGHGGQRGFSGASGAGRRAASALTCQMAKKMSAAVSSSASM